MKIPFELRNFPLHYRRKIRSVSLETSWEEVIWALISVGKRNRAEIYRHGIYSSFDRISKLGLILSVLKQNENEYFIKTNIYKEMDATEKAMVSYNIGMLCSKLFSARLFDTPWLMHVSNIDDIRVWKDTKSRPDLVGLNKKREWVVFEAKGRTHRFDKKAIQTAKEQTRQIKSINGSYPLLKIATESYFNDELKVVLQDPEEYDDDAVELKIDINNFLKKYYTHMRHIEKDTKFLYENYGIHIELSDQLKEAIETDNYETLLESGNELKYDGLIIKVNQDIWNKENLTLDPEHRKYP